MGLLDSLFGATENTSGDAPEIQASAQKAMVPKERTKDLIDAIFEDTVVPCYLLTLDDEATPTLTCSKVGGLPYWPSNKPFPVADPQGLSDDEGFALLAQLDLADFDGDSRLPNHGLLQFYVTQDDLSGLIFDEPCDRQRHHCVVWHEEVDPTVTPESVRALGVKESDPEGFFPVMGEHVLRVSKTRQGVTPSDVRFEAAFNKACSRLFGDGFEDPSASWFNHLEDEQIDEVTYEAEANQSQHRVLGYPFFTQWDPRDAETVAYYDTLLLQLDTDFNSPERIAWGDAGVGNFFINSEALAQGDFSRVLYNWDCC